MNKYEIMDNCVHSGILLIGALIIILAALDINIINKIIIFVILLIIDCLFINYCDSKDRARYILNKK